MPHVVSLPMSLRRLYSHPKHNEHNHSCSSYLAPPVEEARGHHLTFATSHLGIQKPSSDTFPLCRIISLLFLLWSDRPFGQMWAELLSVVIAWKSALREGRCRSHLKELLVLAIAPQTCQILRCHCGSFGGMELELPLQQDRNVSARLQTWRNMSSETEYGAVCVRRRHKASHYGVM